MAGLKLRAGQLDLLYQNGFIRYIRLGDKEIIRMINRLCDEGMSLFVISSELDEIVAYSSRVLVLRDRAIAGELSGEDINTNSILEMIASEPEVTA